MKKNHPVSLLFCFCTLPFLVQCIATQKEMQSTNVRVYSIDSRVEDIDQQVEQLRNQTVKQVQIRQAMVDNRLDSQETEILQLKGKIEESGHFNRLMREENKEIESNLVGNIDDLDEFFQKKQDQLNDAIARVNVQLGKLNEQDKLLNQKIQTLEKGLKTVNATRAQEAAEKARKAAEQARKAAQVAEKAKTKADMVISNDGLLYISANKHKKAIKDKVNTEKIESPSSSGEDSIYADALKLYKNEQFTKAHLRFAEYIDSFPEGKVAANARFWMGESLYKKNEYELAILDYQKVIIDYPQHSKAPAALLKQAMAFEKLNDHETARIVYQKILDNYANSEQIGTAKSQLQKLTR